VYDQLDPEEAARIDAICDQFEQAWKKTKSGGPVPRLASFLGLDDRTNRDVLSQELNALDKACRERYGVAVDAGEAAGNEVIADTRPLAQETDVPPNRSANWPKIPGLELLGILGSGGMGVVFKARQTTLDRVVAVKLLRDDYRVDSEQRERFLREARAVARLRHPHLVQVYEFGEVPDAGGVVSHPYLVLEYISGGNVADVLRGTPQPPKEAARLVETLAEAVHYAHQEGVVHRDLKPANVLLQRLQGNADEPTESIGNPRTTSIQSLTHDLCAKLTDFGLAKFLTGSDLTRTMTLLGTPSYMAPEQAAGKSDQITIAVDIYGLGAILYEMLTGRPPFVADTVDATLRLVREDEPVPPRRLQPTVPRDLETICLKCLRKEPGRRYATAQEIADDLRRFLRGEPVRARPVGSIERIAVWCRRKPVVAGLITALMLVFLAGSAGVIWQWQRATNNAADANKNAIAYARERDIARQETERAEHHLRIVRERVDQLNRLGRVLLRQPGQYRTGQAVLEEALAFYRELLPDEGNDPAVRRAAAQLYHQSADIYRTLGQANKAAEAFQLQANLLASLVKDEPANRDLRLDLADSHRYRGNELITIGKSVEAREAYNQAIKLHEGLLNEVPDNAAYQVALANTLLNSSNLLWREGQAAALESTYLRILELGRAAVRGAPNNHRFKAELALELIGQGLFFMDNARNSEAEAAFREALDIHQKLLAGGQLKGYIEGYVARNLDCLGRLLAATGQTREAETSFRAAVNLLDQQVKDLPESAYPRAQLASALAALADLLKEPDRRPEVEQIRRRVIQLYEPLRVASSDIPDVRGNLAKSYLDLVRLLWELGRQSEAAEPYRKARELDPQDASVNNELAWFLATCPEPRLRDAALAVQLSTRAIAAAPQSGNFRNTLGVAHYRNGDDKAAIAELETSMKLRAGGDASDWFFLSMAHWRSGNHEKARTFFDRAVQWMDKYKPHDDELRRFRSEAEAMVANKGVGSKPARHEIFVMNY
jgi:serine/threonine protein kinase